MFNVEEGFILKQIKDISKSIISIFFGKSLSDKIIDERGVISEDNFLLYRLRKLIHIGEINQAEDLLFVEVENYKSEANLKVALQFYQDLGELDGEFLEVHDFSQAEILDGLIEIKKIYEIIS